MTDPMLAMVEDVGVGDVIYTIYYFSVYSVNRYCHIHGAPEKLVSQLPICFSMNAYRSCSIKLVVRQHMLKGVEISAIYSLQTNTQFICGLATAILDLSLPVTSDNLAV